MPDWNRVRYEMLTRLGYFVTESSEHFAEYVPWFIKRDRPDLIERFNVPLDEYIQRCELQIAGWEFVRTLIENPAAADVGELREEMGTTVLIRDLGRHVDSTVTLAGWLYNARVSSKVAFLVVRDGTGLCQCIVEKGKVPLGYVETKDIGTDLDKVEHTDQMHRYLKGLNNLILTDYLEFRWYVNGEKKLTVRLANVGKNDKLLSNPKAAAVVEQLFHDFFATEAPTVSSSRELASRLAGITHFIRDQIISVLTSGDE